MDEAEETPQGIPANAESREIAQTEEAVDSEERNELYQDGEGDADSWAGVGMDDGDAVLTGEPRQNSPPEGERAAEHATGRRWELPHGCSEPRPRQAENRIADDVLTIFAEAAVENEQIDKAMAAMGIAQNLKEEENVVVGARGRIKVRTTGLGASTAAGDSGERLEDEGRIFWEPLNLESVPSPRQGKHESPQPGTRGTCWVSSEHHRWISSSCATSSKQPHRAHCCQVCALFAGQNGTLQRVSSSRRKDAGINWRDGSLQ